jgi:MazG family protein
VPDGFFMDSFSRLTQIMARLRAPDGCPWDIEQTHQTLRAYLIEESAEVLDAIESGDDAHLCEELGDLLLQPVFHAQIASETGRFTLDDVVNGICEKLIRRHPHVFGDTLAPDADTVLRNWDAIKKQEKAAQGEVSTSILSGIPAELPALAQALKISKKAAKVGFEWPDEASVVEKLREEVAEIEDALQKESNERVAEEIGDLMFTAVNVARWRGLHPELALRDVNRKFMARFAFMEEAAKKRGLELESLSPAQWEEFWNLAKTA